MKLSTSLFSFRLLSRTLALGVSGALLAPAPGVEAAIGAKLEVKACTPEAFEAEKSANKVFVAWFYAGWCPTCRKQRAALESLAGKRMSGGPVVCRFDYDETEQLRKKLGVKRQSSLVRYVKGQETSRSVGETEAPRLERFLQGE